MDGFCSHHCEGCPGEFVCHCLRVTEEALTDAITRFGLQTLNDVRQATGAGDGCTACHHRIRQVLREVAQSSSSEPICSVR